MFRISLTKIVIHPLLFLSFIMTATIHGYARPATQKRVVRPVSTPPTTVKNYLGMKFILIPPGSFTMGSDNIQPGERPRPAHQVILTKPFCIQTTTVTQGQWKQIMNTKPWRSLSSNFIEGDDYPVVYATWDEIQEFILKLNLMKVGSYRLPSEAEWEYACRAGTRTKYSFGDDEDDLERYAWYSMGSQVFMTVQWKERGLYPHKVGTKRPNRWGLYDMHGNVAQACQDWYGPYSDGPVTDPVGPDSGSYKVIRGGGIFAQDLSCRSDSRSWIFPEGRAEGMGFRLVMDPE